MSERRLRRAGPRAAAATLRRSRCGVGAGRDGGPGAGLAGERGRAGRGGDGGGGPSGGQVRRLREGGGAWALATLRKMLLVLRCGREAGPGSPAASIGLQGVTHRPLARLGPGGCQVTHLRWPSQPYTLAWSPRDSMESFSALAPWLPPSLPPPCAVLALVPTHILPTP